MRSSLAAALTAMVGMGSGGAWAQSCGPQWLNGAMPQLNGTVYASAAWDPDGAGPRAPGVVIGGSFTLAGTTAVSNLAFWDGVTLTDIGGGVSGTNHGTTAVNALAVMPNGDLVVGGAFDTAGAGGGVITANCIARFNGAAWAPMGQGVWRTVDTVQSMAAGTNGDLVVVGGLFLNLDNAIAGPLVRWNDATAARWNDFSASLPAIASLRTVAALSNGDVVIGGVQGTAPGSSAAWRWNAAQSVWQNFGTGVTGTAPLNQVFSVLELAGGELALAGNFTSAGGVAVNSIARWNGSQFFPYGTGITYPGQAFALQVRALAQMPNGDIVAGGQFDTAGGNVGGRVARWDGANWARLPQGAGDIVWTLLRTREHELIVGGAFTFAGGSFANKRVARYTDLPSAWVAVDPVGQTVAPDGTLVLSATAAAGFVNVNVQWKRDGVAIVNGPGGASAGGGAVSGASAALASPTAGAASVLTITGFRPSDTGVYTAEFTNSCGSGASAGAEVKVGPCVADLTGDGTVDLSDFFEFFNCFDQTSACADLDGNPGVDLGDFFAFFNAFDASC